MQYIFKGNFDEILGQCEKNILRICKGFIEMYYMYVIISIIGNN